MKISHLNDVSRLDRGTGKTNGNEHPKASSSGIESEKLSISSLSTRLNDIETKLGGAAEFDSARVQEIKQAIRDGQFKINPEAVADRLIESVKEMLGK
jgi:negative regulator of flagellin synthesis FlgM